MMELILQAKKALLGTAVALVVVDNSFKNLAYGVICWITSSKGILILIWEKLFSYCF